MTAGGVHASVAHARVSMAGERPVAGSHETTTGKGAWECGAGTADIRACTPRPGRLGVSRRTRRSCRSWEAGPDGRGGRCCGFAAGSHEGRRAASARPPARPARAAPPRGQARHAVPLTCPGRHAAHAPCRCPKPEDQGAARPARRAWTRDAPPAALCGAAAGGYVPLPPHGGAEAAGHDSGRGSMAYTPPCTRRSSPAGLLLLAPRPHPAHPRPLTPRPTHPLQFLVLRARVLSPPPRLPSGWRCSCAASHMHRRQTHGPLLRRPARSARWPLVRWSNGG